MPTELYLDSARLGLMPPRARRAHHDFVRLISREGASAAVVEFLRGGFDSWPAAFRRRHPDLGDWRGVGPFLQAIRALTGAPPAAEVLLSGHSAPLMGLAARLLCQSCRVVFHTDLEWPPYLEILRAEAVRFGRRLAGMKARELLLEDRAEADELIARLMRGYRTSDADGLFLTEVTHDGIHLPVRRLVSCLSAFRAPRFVVVDAAQALGHTLLDLEMGPGDVYLAGCHKWVGSGLPLSLAVAPRRRTRGLVRELADSLIVSGRLDDPLLRFTRTLSTGDIEDQGETVNLAPLFSASAAVSGQLGQADLAARRIEQRTENGRILSLAAGEAGWSPVVPHEDFQSGILMLRAVNYEVSRTEADQLRRLFGANGVTLTAYPGGLVRASLPDIPWTEDQLGMARSAFTRVRSDAARRGSERCWGGARPIGIALVPGPAD
jgi:hypothetical protein